VPEQVTTPASAYERLVAVDVEVHGVSELAGCVAAAMIVPYPPGIPVIMPGERFAEADNGLLRSLTASQQLDTRFPGFETEIHGIHIAHARAYRIPCIT
jgi:arginine decarboxylase